MSTTSRLVDVLTVDDRSREQARSLYEASFPAALRAPFRDLVGPVPGERCLLLTIGDDAAVSVQGLAVVRDLGRTGCAFLRYVAIDPQQRGAGLGSLLWRLLTADLTTAGARLLLLDVEDPDEPGLPAHELEERRRRVVFYDRLHAAVLPVTGYAPPEHGDGSGDAPAMRLLGARLGAPDTAAAPPPLRGAELAAAVVAVYEHRYGLTADDPVVRDTLLRSGLAAAGGA